MYKAVGFFNIFDFSIAYIDIYIYGLPISSHLQRRGQATQTSSSSS